MGIHSIQPRIIAEVQHDKMRPSFDTIFQFVDDNDDLVFEFSVPFLRKKLKKPYKLSYEHYYAYILFYSEI